MKCTVEKVDSPFSDEMYFFDMQLPDNWEEFLSDFKEIIGHEKNTKYSYFSGPPKSVKKGWYLCKARAEKARVWVLANFDEVIWCGETLKPENWRQENKQKSQSKSPHESGTVGLSPEMEFMQAIIGNGNIPKDIKHRLNKAIYKSTALILHPDKGGNTEWMQKINVAYEQLIKQLGEVQ